MDKIRAEHPELSDAEVRLRAERDHIESLRLNGSTQAESLSRQAD